MKRSKSLSRRSSLRRTTGLTRRTVPKAFRAQRDPAFTRWLYTEPCELLGGVTTQRLSLNDIWLDGGFVHQCWGPIDPAHVGKHRAQGAPDLGACIPLCRAAHQFYDEHRSSWAKVTGYTEERMQEAAQEYAETYLGQHGARA